MSNDESQKVTCYKITTVDGKSCLCDTIEQVLDDIKIHLLETNDPVTVKKVTLFKVAYDRLKEFDGW